MTEVLSFAPQVERALLGYMPVRESLSKPLQDAMYYSITAGGKRLRPCLCLYGAQLFGGNPQEAMPYACAVEMIHTYSLIHDDLPAMDDDDLRRGKPTCHKAFGEATAILAGDALLTHAFEVMTQAALIAKNQTVAIRAMHLIAACCGTRGMLGGQMADVNPPEGVDKRALLTYIEQNKTAKLIKASLVSGLMLGSAPDDAIMAFTVFASHFGAAFQITDDILDELGDEATAGKTLRSDQGADKLTAVSLMGLERAQKSAKRHVDEAVEAIARYPKAQSLKDLALGLMNRNT